MSRRPLKYVEGEPIETMNALAEQIAAGGYLIERTTKQRIHPGWAASWQFSMCMNAIRRRSLLRAIPNPEHPDNKEPSK